MTHFASPPQKKALPSADHPLVVQPRRPHSKQRGFTLGELLLVLVIIGVLTIIGFRSIQPIIISGRVSATATDINTAAQRIIQAANADGSSTTSYSGTDNTTLAGLLTGTNMFQFTTAVPPAITHRLSTVAAGASVAVASGTITSTNDAFTITFSNVHLVACSDLASLLQASATQVKINNSANFSKNAAATTPVAFNGVTAAGLCTGGNTNTLAFTYQ